MGPECNITVLMDADISSILFILSGFVKHAWDALLNVAKN